MKHALKFDVLRPLFTALVLACGTVPVMAHTPLFDCFDNGDASITCEGGYSDGASAEGVDIQVVDARGKILERGKLDARGAVLLQRPEGEFSVVFAPDSEHSIRVLGDDIY